MKRIDRFILRQLIPLFFMGILAFTTLILGVGGIYKIIRIATDHNVNIIYVIRAFIYKLPEIVTYTLPMATLFCILLEFNRMSCDLEVTAIRAAGLSFRRPLAPVVVFSFFVSLFALYMNDRVVPLANDRFNTLIFSIQRTGTLESKNIFLKEEQDGVIKRAFFVGELNGRRLTGVTVQEYEKGKPAKVIIADQAYWSHNNKLVLHDVQAYMFHGAGKLPGDKTQYTYFNTKDTMEISLSINLDDMMRQQKQSGELTIRQLRDQIQEMKRQGVEKQIVRKIQVDFHSKLSIPFASLAFALIGAPLGLRPSRASSSVGLGVSVIIIFFYYMFQQLFRGMGGSFMSPALAAWMPNMLVFAAGLWLCARADK